MSEEKFSKARPTIDGRYAIELGVSLKLVKTAGGATKLRSLEPHIRNLLLGVKGKV